MLDDESPTEAFWGSPKQSHDMLKVDNIIPLWIVAMRAYAQSGQYDTIVESRVRLTQKIRL